MKSLLILLISVSTIVVSTAALPFTFYVNPGDRIQEAIDIAVDDDIIIVRDGVYTGDGNRDIDFRGKAITLISENGPDVTIIDCEGTDEDDHRGFYFNSGEGPDSVVDGFTITNGYMSGDGADESGGGIYCSNSSPTITNCIVNGNSTYYGAAIYCDESDAVITECTISGNHGGAGGGIYCDSSNPAISNCTISENHGGAGGGIYCIFDSSPMMTNCTINGNSATLGGGIICFFSSNPTITNCTINDNTAGEWGGGIYCEFSSSPVIIDCTISENLALSDHGGGIFCYYGSNPVIINCTITNNSADYGGGVSCVSSDMAITNSTIIGNTAAVGGGIHCYGRDPTLANCIISGNLAEFGGGISCKESDPMIASCTISGNRASKYGGGFFCYVFSSPTITNSILWGNTSTDGHEIALMNHDNNPSTLSAIYSDVQGGAADAYIESGCTLDLDGTNIDADPLFVKGPLHDYYLSQVASGQDADSPCIDAGSDTAENLGIDELSTRTDGIPDTGRVDMGYHAPYALWIYSITPGSDDITIRWNALPGVSYTVQLSTDLERWMSIPAHQTDTWTDTNAGGYRKKFYRVLEQ